MPTRDTFIALKTNPDYNTLIMKIDIHKTAALANIPVTKDEVETLEQQLIETLTYVQRLNEVKTDDVSPTSQVTGLENVTREDSITASFSQEEALKNAKHTYNGFFMVKAILDQA